MANENKVDLMAMFQKASDARGPASNTDGSKKHPFQITVSVNDESHFHFWNAIKKELGIQKNADLLVKMEELSLLAIKAGLHNKKQ